VAIVQDARIQFIGSWCRSRCLFAAAIFVLLLHGPGRTDARAANPAIAQDLRSRHPAIRLRGLRHLEEKPSYAPTLLALVAKLLEDEDEGVSYAAGYVLRNAGRAALPFLGAALDSKNPEAQAGAISELGVLHKDASSYLPKIKSIVTSDRSSRVRSCAVLALGHWEDPSVLPLILRIASDDKDEHVRTTAAIAASFYGEPAAGAVPFLLKIVRDGAAGTEVSRMLVAGEAGNALSRIGKPAVPVLCKVLSDKSELSPMRREAAWSCGKMRENGSAAVPELVRCVADPDAGLRQDALLALGYIGVKSSDVKSTLVRACGDADAGVRSNAVVAMQNLALESPEIVAAATKLLDDSQPLVRFAACNFLGFVGKKASPAVPGLIRCLRHTDAKARREAAQALGSIGELASSAAPVLNQLLEDKDNSVRAEAKQALRLIGAGRQKIGTPRHSKNLTHPGDE
jgi:HEAT repeat protein